MTKIEQLKVVGFLLVTSLNIFLLVYYQKQLEFWTWHNIVTYMPLIAFFMVVTFLLIIAFIVRVTLFFTVRK